MKEWLRDVLLAPKPWGPLGQKLMQLKAGENFIPRRLKAALGITAMTSGILPVLSGWSGRDGLVERPLHADYVDYAIHAGPLVDPYWTRTGPALDLSGTFCIPLFFDV